MIYTPPSSAGTETVTASYSGDSSHVADSLIKLTDSMGLDKEVTQSLDEKLNAAFGFINDGNNRATVNQLSAFVKVNPRTLVETQSSAYE